MRSRASLAFACVLGWSCGLALAQTPIDTAFTYQGFLADAGLPAAGLHDLRFRLYDAAAGGVQVGPSLCADDVLLSQGRFAVALDFGAQFAGQARYLEIDVRADTGLGCGDATGFVLLSPRQALTGAPNAIFSLNAASATTATTATTAATATNATQLNGQPASFYQDAANLTAGTLPSARLTGAYTGALTFSNAGNAFTGAFSGSGAGLAALNASNVSTGTLADARLSANVALLAGLQTFSGVKTFSAAPAFSAAGSPFSVANTTLVSNLNADLLDGLNSTVFAQLAGTQTWAGANTFSNVGNSFTGSGAGLTALNATNLASGLLADARLSGNVALLNAAQTFSAGKTFSAAPSFTATGAPFSVSSGTLVTNLNADRLDGLDSTAFLQSIPVPLTLSGIDGSHIIQGVNASTGGLSSGVYGLSTAATGTTYGVYGVSTSWGSVAYGPAAGVFGYATSATGATCGGFFESASSTEGYGVYGLATAASGLTFGVYGMSHSTSGIAVAGWSSAATGATYGVHGTSRSTDGRGVFGQAIASSGTTYGVYGQSDSWEGRGVYGVATFSGGFTSGVHGQSASPDGRGVFGHATSAFGANYGVSGQSDSTTGTGVFGWASAATGTTAGVNGYSNSTSGYGVSGSADATSGATYGVAGRSDSTDGTGVYGSTTAGTGTTYGGRFQSASTDGRGVHGAANSPSGATYGGYFTSNSSTGTGVYGSGVSYGVVGDSGAFGIGVYGHNFAGAFGSGDGVYGQSDGINGRGVVGYVPSGSGLTYAVVGYCNSPSGYGTYSFGNTGATGTKSFRIDHPDDPENKYLLHYAAESPEVINFYSETVTLDERGEAVVELPHYFAKINTRPRYQLTAVGAPMPMLHVAEKISESALGVGASAEPGVAAPICSFRIAGGAPGGEVSWEVKAVRNDRWVQQRGAPVEIDKQGLEKGLYQHPELYHQPPEKGMNYDSARQRPEPAAASPG